jgi:hypothetical protein
MENIGWNENTGLYSPPLAKIYFKGTPSHNYNADVIQGKDTIRHGAEFLDIWGHSPYEKPTETILFKDFFIGTISRNDSLLTPFYKYSLSDKIYEVPRDGGMTTAREPTDIISVYWSDKKGVVGYIYKNGEQWVLKTK